MDGDPKYMAEALRLARRGLGRTRPNPAVGAVVVKDGKIVGRGYHRHCGAPHAEVEALNRAGSEAKGADLYVTLEPCGHAGRTPPCAFAILQAGIRRVFFGCPDPNPITAGKGPAMLRQAGVTVCEGPLIEEARRFNAPYLKWVTARIPFVTAKWAMTLDGKIGTKTGQARWITGERARRAVHRLRNQVDAILVGTNTVLKDDPLLTCRLRGGRTPLRVVLDRRGRIPLDCALFSSLSEGPVIVYTAEERKAEVEALRSRGIETVCLPEQQEELDLGALLKDLGGREIQHLLVEGGGTLLGSFFDGGFVDRLLVFVAPKVVGGAGAVTPVAGRGVASMSEALGFEVTRIERFGQDLAVWAEREEIKRAEP